MAAEQSTKVLSNEGSNADSNTNNDELVLDELQLNEDTNVHNIIRRASSTYIECNKDILALNN